MSLFDTLNISASGLSAQRTRVDLLAENIANSQTTRTPAGGPYRRRHAVFSSEPEAGSSFASLLQGYRAAFRTPVGLPWGAEGSGVRVAEIVVDSSQPRLRYLPNHPDAGADGYVAFPAFNPVEDMVDLTAGVRAYQANLAVISAVKEMIHRTIDISR